ncbi:MAG: hypothetical protein GX362_06550 [Methanosarcinaceae archaeon]|nr:hypothetical protein [Methanosarcinaceae archaeon]
MCYEFDTPLPSIYTRACNNTIICCEDICRERTYKEFNKKHSKNGGPKYIVKYERPTPATLNFYGNLRHACIRSLNFLNQKKQQNFEKAKFKAK